MRLRKKKNDWSVLRYLAYFTQFGVAMIVPPLLCAVAAYWLKNRFGWGGWTVVVGILLGVGAACVNVRELLLFTERQAQKRQREEEQWK